MADITEELNPLSLLLLPVHRMCLLCARLLPRHSEYPYCPECLETANPIVCNPYTGEWEPYLTGPWFFQHDTPFWDVRQCAKCGRFYLHGYLPHCFDIAAAKPLCPDCLVSLQPFINGSRFALCSECRRLWEEWGDYAYRIRWTPQPVPKTEHIDEDWEKKMAAEFGLDSPSLRSVTKDINSII